MKYTILIIIELLAVFLPIIVVIGVIDNITSKKQNQKKIASVNIIKNEEKNTIFKVEDIQDLSKNNKKENNTTVYQIILGIFLTIMGFSMMMHGHSGEFSSGFSLMEGETYRKA